MQHMLVDDSPRYALHQLRVRNGVEILRQIGIRNIRVALVQQFVHFLNRILRAFLRPVLTRCADEKQTLSWIRLTISLRSGSSTPERAADHLRVGEGQRCGLSSALFRRVEVPLTLG
jgi:hypothetical protein